MTTLSLQVATRYHDWSDAAALAQVVESFAAAGLLGDVAWSRIDFGPKCRATPIARGADRAATIIALLPPINRTRALDIGGNQPASWSAQLMVAPYRADRAEVAGTNAASIEVAGVDDPLAMISTIDECARVPGAECGWIHEPESERRLRAAFAADPVFSSLIFPCVFWCNLLGPRVIDHFDRARLDGLDAAEVSWREDGGLWLRATDTLSQATTPEGEDALRELSARFIAARRQL